MDISILHEVDKISESHLRSCPCCNQEIDVVAKKLALDSVDKVQSNSLLKSSPSVGLDIIKQNRGNAIEVVAAKYNGEPCKLQSEYASSLWNGFAEKYDIDNPQVRMIVSSIIVLGLRAYKMSGQEIIYNSYDKQGNEIINLVPTIPEGRKYLESLVKSKIGRAHV